MSSWWRRARRHWLIDRVLVGLAIVDHFLTGSRRPAAPPACWPLSTGAMTLWLCEDVERESGAR